jgi:hypothetical protein
VVQVAVAQVVQVAVAQVVQVAVAQVVQVAAVQCKVLMEVMEVLEMRAAQVDRAALIAAQMEAAQVL